MAEYSRREVTAVRVEYFLPNPTNAAEFGKAYSAAERAAEAAGIKVADDTITVEGRDEEIVLSFEKFEKKEKG